MDKESSRCLSLKFFCPCSCRCLLTVVISSLMIYAIYRDLEMRRLLFGLWCGRHETQPYVNRTTKWAYDYLVEHPAVYSFQVVKGKTRRSVNRSMYRWLVDKGISSQRLIKEDRSTSTQENLRSPGRS